MRYFNFVLKTTAAKIEKATEATKKIKLSDYEWHNPLGAVNHYMYQNLKNGITFVAYREENDSVSATFSYDERKGTFDEAYDYITGILSDVFSVTKISSEPDEITAAKCYDCFLEAKRRGLNTRWRVVDIANLEFYENRCFDKEKFYKYELQEKIISKRDDQS